MSTQETSTMYSTTANGYAKNEAKGLNYKVQIELDNHGDEVISICKKLEPDNFFSYECHIIKASLLLKCLKDRKGDLKNSPPTSPLNSKIQNQLGLDLGE